MTTESELSDQYGDTYGDPFATLLTLAPEGAEGSDAGQVPVARHGHFGDGLFGEAKPTAPRGLVARLLSGTLGSIVAVGAGLGLVLGVGVSLVGGGDDAPAVPTASGQAAGTQAGAGQQGAGSQGGQQAGAGQAAGQAGQGAGQGSGQGAAAGSSAKPSIAVDSKGRPTLTGSFTLWAADPQKNACADHPQVPDIKAGAAVVLSDGSGKQLARTTLSAGTVEATKRGCVFPFQVAGLPKTDSYQLKVGRQGALTFSATDLAGNGWRVQLNLGLPSQTTG
jgi:hypothetical protein